MVHALHIRSQMCVPILLIRMYICKTSYAVIYIRTYVCTYICMPCHAMSCRVVMLHVACALLRFSSAAGVQFWILDKWRHLQVRTVCRYLPLTYKYIYTYVHMHVLRTLYSGTLAHFTCH